MDAGEADFNAHSGKITLVEIDHRAVHFTSTLKILIQPFEEVFDGSGIGLGFAPPSLPPELQVFLHAVVVDRLEKRRPSPGFKHAKKLAQRLALVVNVDQNRAGRDEIDGFIRDRPQVLRSRLNKGASIKHAHLPGATLDMLQQGFGDIREDDTSRPADLVQSAESDQALAGADVENDLALPEPGFRQEPVPNASQTGHLQFGGFLITSETCLPKPSRPWVMVRHRRL